MKKLFWNVHHASQSLWAPMCTLHFENNGELKIFKSAVDDENSWLSRIWIDFQSENGVLITGWSRFHTELQRRMLDHPGVNTISPLLRDKVNTLHMQNHCLLLNMQSTKVLNENQIPVDVSDQPAFALTKELQFRLPNIFSDYLPFVGGLHIEQSLLSLYGELIKETGLLEILPQHNFSTIGTSGLSTPADVTSIKRARYCLQVSLCALYIKLRQTVRAESLEISPLEWLDIRSSTSQMCFFWKMVMNFEINVLIFVRSIREGNFEVYIESLRKVINWYFILDKYHYARWLAIHLFDLLTLDVKFPEVYTQMQKGFFSFQKSNREFSRMALDQIHEQNNRVIKSCADAVDLVNKEEESQW